MPTVTVTATGAGSFTIPANVSSITVEVWGPGANGGALTTADPGGAGGDFIVGTFPVSAGNILYWNVGVGNTGRSWANVNNNAEGNGTGAIGAGVTSTGSTYNSIGWTSVVANYGGPTTAAQGGGGSRGGSGGGGSGGPSGGGSQGSAGSGSAGGAGGSGSAGQAQGGATSGQAGTSVATGNSSGGGGAGGAGAGGAGGAGGVPGGGGGGGGSSSGAAGLGGRGQLRYTYTVEVPLTPITGSLNVTLAEATLVSVATDKLPISGTLNSTLSDATAAGAATLTIKAAGANTLAAATASGAGALTITGSSTRTLVAATTTSAGSLTITANSTNTLGAATTTSAAKISIAGNLGVKTEALINPEIDNNGEGWESYTGVTFSAGKADVVSGVRILRQSGVLIPGRSYTATVEWNATAGGNLSLANNDTGTNGDGRNWVWSAVGSTYTFTFTAIASGVTLEADGSVFSGSINRFSIVDANPGVTLSSATLTATGGVPPLAANLNVTLSAATAAGAAKLSIAASLNQNLLAAAVSATAYLPVVGSATNTLAPATATSVAKLPIVAQSSTTLGAATTTSSGTLGLRGSVTQTLAPATGSSAAALPIRAQVGSTLNAAISNSSAVLPIVGAGLGSLSPATSASAGKLPITGVAGVAYGPQLFINGTVDNDTTGFVKNGDTIIQSVNGKLRVTLSNVGHTPWAGQMVPTEIGKSYEVSVEGFGSGAGWSVNIGTNWGFTDYGFGGYPNNDVAKVTTRFVATTTSVHILVATGGATAGDYAEFDNFSVRELTAVETLTLQPATTTSSGMLYVAAVVNTLVAASTVSGAGKLSIMSQVSKTLAAAILVAAGTVYDPLITPAERTVALTLLSRQVALVASGTRIVVLGASLAREISLIASLSRVNTLAGSLSRTATLSTSLSRQVNLE